jgi:Transferrin receptor-like dimerisation domain
MNLTSYPQAFGPGLWEGYGGVVFPAISDAMLTRDEISIQSAVDATAAAVRNVIELIRTRT